MIGLGLAILAIAFGLAGVAGGIARDDNACLTGLFGALLFFALLLFELAA